MTVQIIANHPVMLNFNPVLHMLMECNKNLEWSYYTGQVLTHYIVYMFNMGWIR